MKKIILVIIVFISGIAFTYAADLIFSSDIYFDNTNSNLKATNMQEAIDELYSKINNTCEKVSKPNLGENNLLIPVTISSDGTVTYVSENDESWYNYCDKRWANAVILEDEVSYKIGDTIKEEDIESYFVWIPKYKYKLWNTGVASKSIHEIEIVFDENNTTDIEGYSCVTPMVSGESGNCDNGEYMTHPAFITMDTNGFWVGKFETGYRGATDKALAQVNASEPENVIIKPNVYSWRNSKLYNMFLTSYNYQRDLESHMMKNTEWGAVVYLSHSKYGIAHEVNINNNSSYKTGYGALASTVQQKTSGTNGDGDTYNNAYNTEVGYLASTTGNISGIYDMSGGASEYVAGYVSGKVGSSGFTTTTIAEYDSKYFDVYNSSSCLTCFKYRILGDATGEMGPFITYDSPNRWYDYANFIEPSYPWFDRGGKYSDGSNAGLTYSQRSYATSVANISFRIVLTP